jgi:hypothetical protein
MRLAAKFEMRHLKYSDDTNYSAASVAAERNGQSMVLLSACAATGKLWYYGKELLLKAGRSSVTEGQSF